jgi:hypothetical protein
MLQRLGVLALLLLLLAASPPPKPVAPSTVSHPIAMFLTHLSSEGKQLVTFKAAATGKYFFFAEVAGVTVYTFDGTNGYRKEAFLKGYTLTRAMKKYR